MTANIWIIFIVFMILSWIVSATLKSKFKKYSKIPVDSGMSGRDVAERMLRDNGIFDVRVESVPGSLTDHYNPQTRTITSVRMFITAEVLLLLPLLPMKQDMLSSMPLLMPGWRFVQKWFLLSASHQNGFNGYYLAE